MHRRTRRTLRGLSVAGLALGAILPAFLPASAQASVFVNGVKWPANGDGYAIIHVCVISGSSTLERADGAAAILIHDPNPSLDDVLAHVQSALASSWELAGGVRFVDWKPCDVLTPEERLAAVGLYIHPDAGNDSNFGVTGRGKTTVDNHGLSFKPWGNDFNRCIVYDPATTHMAYHWECAEQYAIHEFGHLLGFEHEWRHPSTPAACTAEKGEPVIPAGSYTSVLTPGFAYTVVSDVYDWDSIMTYAPECADVTGVRFGSPNLSPTDIAGAMAVYPKPPIGPDDVGVIPERADDCPGEVIAIHMDDEDDANSDFSSGSLGANRQDQNTTFVFCRVPFPAFRAAPPSSPGARDGDYAVLKLGPSCPAGSEEFFRQFDNEDDDNRNTLSGRAAPNVQNADGTTSTRLTFCLFRPETTGVLAEEFPDLGYRYGVFAAPDFTLGLEFGAMHTDDEDDANANQVGFRTFDAGPAASRIFTFNRNTDLRLARVRTRDFWINPVGTPSSPQRVGTTEACTATIDGVNGLGGTCEGATSLCLFGTSPDAKPETSATLGLGGATVNVVGVGLDGYRKASTSYLDVFDAISPSVSCTAPQTAECQGPRTTVPVDAQCADTCGACTAGCLRPPSGFGLGETPVRCTATDAAGNVSQCRTSVTVVDTVAPAVACPAPQTVECTGSRSAAATFAAIATDACDAAPVATCSPASGTSLPLGTTPVTCSAFDASGNQSACATTVTVRDTRPPAVACPAPVVVECTGQRQAVAEFTASAADVCDGALTPSCMPASGGSFLLGTTRGICDARDGTGNVAVCGYSVTVRDTIPPTIAAVTASPSLLWPPNRRMVPVTIGVSQADACDPAAACRIVGVASDEPGTGDWTMTGPLSVDLRAARNGRGNGRTYTVTVECGDVSGNTSRGTVSVEVPIRP